MVAANMTSPARPPGAQHAAAGRLLRPPQAANPKRVPSNLSVCLRPSHDVRPILQGTAPTSPSSFPATNPAPKSPPPPAAQPPLPSIVRARALAAAAASHRAPPSHRDAPNARSWFDDSNRDVAGRGNVSFVNNDPPFYLKRKSSGSDESVSNLAAGSSARAYGYAEPRSEGATAGSRAILRRSRSRASTNDSRFEDFRSVIDDLTIENRKLKQRLRRYEQSQRQTLTPSHDDKLFEIHVHSLPADRRRQLERTLQDFASHMGDDCPNTVSADAPSLSGPTPSLPASSVPPRRHANGPKGSSSSTSNSRPVDSAYASMSTSGRASATQARRQDLARAASPATVQTKDQSVHSYLQTMSQALLPRQSYVMTDKARRRMVVRRLEQIFTGRGDSSSRHSQSVQQQEVSQLAASADRREIEARGHHVLAEGRREAKIFPSSNNLEPSGLPNGVSASFSNARQVSEASETSSRDTSGAGDGTPDQRPTRPLDLDPSRAQNATENIEYLRHLGFASPKMHLGADLGDGERWVSLNLLMNMAQLHTINVTGDFVRSAVTELSARLELSADGRSLRWRGGPFGTRWTSESGADGSGADGSGGASTERSTESIMDESEDARLTISSKLARPSVTGHSGTSAYVQSSQDPSPRNIDSDQQSRSMLPSTTSQAHPSHYQPLFPRAAPVDDSDTSSSVASAAPSVEPGEGLDEPTAQAFNASAKIPFDQTTAASRFSRGTGRLIFYKNATFCTDLGGDGSALPFISPEYEMSRAYILGEQQIVAEVMGESKGVMSQNSSAIGTPSDLVEEHHIRSHLLTPLSSLTKTDLLNWMPDEFAGFEVSGIGGVRPGDHFAYDVAVRHSQSTSGATRQSDVVGLRKRLLQPSCLPSPSYAFRPASTSSSDNGAEVDEDLDDEASWVSDQPANPTRFARGARVTAFSSDSLDRSRNLGADDEDEDDDSSIDMLAHARKLEPEVIAAREKEYAASSSSMGDNSVEIDVDPPASSVVATVGAQSGLDEGGSVGGDSRKGLRAGRKRGLEDGADSMDSPEKISRLA